MDNLISRKALLDDMKYMFRDDDIPISPMDAKLLVEEAPAVEAEPVRHGRWDGDTCTSCKLPWDYLMRQDGDDDGYFDPMPPFCPNCGAKMDLEA